MSYSSNSEVRECHPPRALTRLSHEQSPASPGVPSRSGPDGHADRTIPWLAPAVLGCLALAVRLPHLDHVAHFDELYHFFAAQSWLAEGQLRVADGVYTRTPLFTIFLAQWLGLFGENLVVARLPSLIAGTALVVLVFLWTRAVAGNLAAVVAALLLALDPEHLQISQWGRFYTLHCLLFWLGAIGTYRLVTSPPPAPGRAALLAAGILVCFGAALYLQITTLIGLLGVAVWSALALGLPWLARCSPRARWGIAAGVALLGGAAIWVFVETGLVAELLARYRSTPLFQAENRDAFWYYHAFLTIYYPTLWPLVALAVVIGLAYRPHPTAFCACVVAVAFVVHSFAAPKAMRYLDLRLAVPVRALGHRARRGLAAAAPVPRRRRHARLGLAGPRPARPTWRIRRARRGPGVYDCGQWRVGADRRDDVRLRHSADANGSRIGRQPGTRSRRGSPMPPSC